MKTFIQKLIPHLFTLFLFQSASAQWLERIATNTKTIKQIDITSKDRVYAIANYGDFHATTLMLSEDWGNSWRNVNQTSITPAHMEFLGDSIGFMQDQYGLYKTTDASNSWTKITDQEGRLIVIDENNLKLINTGFNQKVYTHSTNDGGLNWKTDSSAISMGSNTIHDIHFTDSLNGYMAGFDGTFMYNGVILRTTDGGKNWTQQTFMYQWIGSIDFPSKNVGYALGKSAGVLFKTSDAGNSWDTLYTQYSGSGNPSISFINDSVGYVVVNSATESFGEIHKTIDGGKTWTLEYDVTDSTYLNCISVFEDMVICGGSVLNKVGKVVSKNMNVNVIDCDLLCVTDLQLDSAGLHISILNNGDQINYPAVTYVLDENGDTVSTGADWQYYAHLDSSEMDYHNTTSLNNLGNNFKGIINLHYSDMRGGWLDCQLPFPCSNSINEQQKEESRLKVFPNPANDFLTVVCDQGNGNVRLIDLQGKIHFQQNVQASRIQINTSQYAEGIYFLEYWNEQERKMGKVIITH